MRYLIIIFCFCFALGFSQNVSPKDKALLSQTHKLDSLIQNNDISILDLFSDDVSFGHSNGWVQNKNDFKTDFESGKIKYQSVEQIELKELKIKHKFASLRRVVSVKGQYKNDWFEMKLLVLEFWIQQKGIWKLWSRQSVNLKS